MVSLRTFRTLKIISSPSPSLSLHTPNIFCFLHEVYFWLNMNSRVYISCVPPFLRQNAEWNLNQIQCLAKFADPFSCHFLTNKLLFLLPFSTFLYQCCSLMTGSLWLSLLGYVQGMFQGHKKFLWGICHHMMSSCTMLLRKEWYTIFLFTSNFSVAHTYMTLVFPHLILCCTYVPWQMQIFCSNLLFLSTLLIAFLHFSENPKSTKK